MSQAGVKLSEGRLPDDLAAALEPGLRQALESPTRREILRIFNSTDTPLTVRGIAVRLTGFTVSEIGYHSHVLERAGGLVVSEERSSPGAGDERRYLSSVAENLEVLAALRATRQWDLNRRRRRSRRSSGMLKMFRIPRPTRTIRLGDPDWRES